MLVKFLFFRMVQTYTFTKGMLSIVHFMIVKFLPLPLVQTDIYEGKAAYCTCLIMVIGAVICCFQKYGIQHEEL